MLRKRYALLVGVLLMTGCAGKLPLKTATVETLQISNTQAPKSVKFLNKDLSGNLINNDEIASVISNNIITGGEYHATQRFWDHGVTVERGLKYKSSVNGINLEYINGTLWGNRYEDKHFSRIVTRYDYNIVDDNEYKVITIQHPNTITKYQGLDPLFGGPDFLCTNESVYTDLYNKFTNVDNAVIKRKLHVDGEINVEFDSSAIYANYERKLGKYKTVDSKQGTSSSKGSDKTTDIEKKSLYRLEYNGTTLPLEINVYPYRKGSKVVYQIDIPYTIRDIASADISDINKVKDKIEAIAKD